MNAFAPPTVIFVIGARFPYFENVTWFSIPLSILHLDIYVKEIEKKREKIRRKQQHHRYDFTYSYDLSEI